MIRVLVTGASGFAGSHLVTELTQPDYEVHGTVFGQDSDQGLNLKFAHHINLMEREAVKTLIQEIKPDWIFHLAALSSPSKSFDDPRKTLTNNIEAQVNLLDSARLLDQKPKILIIGSAEEYGRVSDDNLPIDENAPLNPMSPYAVSKVAQDFLGLQYYLAYKLPIVRVRPFNHIGERQTEAFVLPAFAKQVAMIEAGKQDPIIKVGNLTSIRDFTDVKDMVKAYELALKNGVAGEVYNIGSGHGITISELLDELLKLSRTPITIQEDPVRMMAADVPALVSNATKFNQVTGWVPELPFKETVNRVLDYWRSRV